MLGYSRHHQLCDHGLLSRQRPIHKLGLPPTLSVVSSPAPKFPHGGTQIVLTVSRNRHSGEFPGSHCEEAQSRKTISPRNLFGLGGLVGCGGWI